MEKTFTLIARKSLWLLLAGVLALGAAQTFASVPGSTSPLPQEHQLGNEAHSGWLAEHVAAADPASQDRPDDGAMDQMLCLLACMALGAQVDVLFVDLPAQTGSHAEPMRPAVLRGKPQTQPGPNTGPPRPAFPV